MTGESRQKPKKAILSDHKRIGKEFIPPFIHMLPAIHDVKWVDRPLPELLWLALLNEELGVHKGAELASSISKSVVEAPNVQRTWFAPLSAYSTLDDTQKESILKSLESKGHIEDMKTALKPLVTLYPKCPLGFLYDTTPAIQDKTFALKRLRYIMADLFDKTTKSATFMQANAIYIAFVTELLVVSSSVSLANFPAIQDYPDTDESQRIASSVRASINAFFGMTDIEIWWPGYFWNRGLEIDECLFDIGEHDE